MKIALSGLHGQGKTTIINRLKEHKALAKYTFADSPTRKISETYPINTDGTQTTQLLVMMGHYLNQLPDNVILDRCAIDGLAYTTFFSDKIDYYILESINYLFYYLMSQYDIIFYIEPELEIEDDGVRSTDISFFNEVKNNFNKIIKQKVLTRLKPVVYVKGSVDDRVNTIIQTIKQYEHR